MLARTNEGTSDRVIRIVLGLVLIALVFTGPRTAWGWIGLVPLLTGLLGFCPMYATFSFSTAPRH